MVRYQKFSSQKLRMKAWGPKIDDVKKKETKCHLKTPKPFLSTSDLLAFHHKFLMVITIIKQPLRKLTQLRLTKPLLLSILLIITIHLFEIFY
ncbi:unnamed protein product [Blepharisma stoltei]|uniref:Uncharacterized protein n=1 Tax=Blepharisma stoltei TaxID=1481888 RepID=A0AAU9K117_9CILI|nr:unnamed protein product [Blepharisma stoltei]